MLSLSDDMCQNGFWWPSCQPPQESTWRKGHQGRVYLGTGILSHLELGQYELGEGALSQVGLMLGKKLKKQYRERKKRREKEREAANKKLKKNHGESQKVTDWQKPTRTESRRVTSNRGIFQWTRALFWGQKRSQKPERREWRSEQSKEVNLF